MNRTVAASLMVVLTFAASACSKDSTDDATTTPSSSPATAGVTVKLTEFAFIMPESVPAGLTTLHIENVGGMPHFIDISGVDGQKTNDDIEAYLASPDSNGPDPKWLHPVDVPGISLLSTQTSTDVTVDLPEGRYAFFCWMPDADGTPHAMVGMHAVFDAVAGDQTTEAPQVDVAVSATDGEPVVPETIPEGPATIGYSNESTKPNDVAIARILIDAPIPKVLKMVNEWFGSAYQGDPPVEFLGGLSGIPGEMNAAGTTTVDFVPGVYVFGGAGNDLVVREVGGGGYPAAPSPTVSGEAACGEPATSTNVVAEGFVFDQACITVPADTAFTITLDNQDADAPHNVAIWPSAGDGTDALFTGELLVGPATTTYDVEGLPAGTYVFRCDVHPTTMTGTLTAG